MKMATTIPNYLHAMMDYYRNNLEHKEPKLRTSTNKCCTDVADRSVLKKMKKIPYPLSAATVDLGG